ncbi:MAG: YicC family protein [Oscillospiraceae bacterium]|nr:YicC family protein [Oscillospiraceae bacterium]
MIKSMTGYGNAVGASGDIGLTVEVRSVNNRFLDCSVRMPRMYIFAEDKIKAVVQKYISRGKVDVFVTVDSSKADDVVVSLNEPLAEAYISAYKQMSEKYGLKNDLSAVSLGRIQDVFTVEKKEIDADAFTADIEAVTAAALDNFNAMREVEGNKLRSDILDKLSNIEALAAKVEERSPQTVAEYRARLEQKMSEVLATADIDKSRIVTEAAIFADKVAVDEELVRLRSHIAQMRDMLAKDGAIGRKLDFLTQELNREANTTGSKCNDVEITRMVVDIKSEIEKIREQIQNIE